MKKVISLIFFFNIFFQNFLSAQGFNDISSGNGESVFAVGNNGLIIHSEDGGINWFRYYLGNNNYNSISTFPQTIWIVGDNGELEKSTNSGNTFFPIVLPTNTKQNSIYFVNPGTGWIAGNNGTILKSTNTGLNWTVQASNTSNNLNQIKFSTISNGVACGSDGTVLVTSDGGNTWINSNTPTTKELLSIDIKGNTIFCCGAESVVLKSTNRGNSWNSIDYKIETKSDVTSLTMMDSLNYFSIGGGGFIRKSTDGGQTFVFKSNPLLADINKIFFYHEKGWCISKNVNVIIKTINGGDNWSLPSGVSQSFSWEFKIPSSFYTSGNVFAFNPENRNEIFVTKLNTILRSVNKGDSWQQISSINYVPANSPSNAFLISPKDTNVFLVALDSGLTEKGKVFRSTDYGQTWSITFSGKRNSDGCPLEMDPNHTDTVYYAPSDSFLYRSTNFGLTWNQVGNKKFGDICVIEVLENNSNTILTGDATLHGTLYRSSDYGISWNNVNDTNSFEIPDLANSKLNPDIVYCTFFQGMGGLKWSTDKGESFCNVNINYYAWAVDISRDDPNTYAYGTFSNNPIYMTTDGGMTFFPTAVLSGGAYALYYYDRSTMIAQMTDGFYKLKINYSVPIGITKINSIVPNKYLLSQNYPNPFNPVTKINYSLPAAQYAILKVYDALGKEVIKLVNERLSAGSYQVEFDGTNLPSGIYFYKLETAIYSEVKQMLLLK